VERAAYTATFNFATNADVGTEMRAIGVENVYLAILGSVSNKLGTKVFEAFELTCFEFLGGGHHEPSTWIA
jgi:hypothetical protein